VALAGHPLSGGRRERTSASGSKVEKRFESSGGKGGLQIVLFDEGRKGWENYSLERQEGESMGKKHPPIKEGGRRRYAPQGKTRPARQPVTTDDEKGKALTLGGRRVGTGSTTHDLQDSPTKDLPRPGEKKEWGRDPWNRLGLVLFPIGGRGRGGGTEWFQLEQSGRRGPFLCEEERGGAGCASMPEQKERGNPYR